MGPCHLVFSAGHGCADHLDNPADAWPVHLDVFRGFLPHYGSLRLGPASPIRCLGHVFGPEPLRRRGSCACCLPPPGSCSPVDRSRRLHQVAVGIDEAPLGLLGWGAIGTSS